MMDFLGEERQELNSIRRSMNFYKVDLNDHLSAEVEKLHTIFREVRNFWISYLGT